MPINQRGVNDMSGLAYNFELRERARSLRSNMTPQEKHLWYDFLNSYPVRFRRQRPIGDYIVDFYCPKAKLVVELDGNEHFTEEGRRSDARRKEYLESLGLKVLRFPDWDVVKNFERVCRHIDVEARSRCPGLNLKRE